jgi:hypothetical protein
MIFSFSCFLFILFLINTLSFKQFIQGFHS